jgi:two-component system cell cycle sensor histidine kinase/response regulator CckA
MRWRSFASLAGLLALLVAGLAGLYTTFTAREIRQSELQQTLHTTTFAHSILAREIEDLAARTADWARRPELALLLSASAHTSDPAEVAGPFAAAPYGMALLVRDRAGHWMTSQWRDPAGEIRPLTDEERAVWAAAPVFEGPARAGLVQLTDLWLLSSHPVGTPPGPNAGGGRLVVARPVDSALAELVSQRLGLTVRLIPLAKPEGLNPTLTRALLGARVNEPISMRGAAGGLLGVLVLPDLQGKSVLALHVEQPAADPVRTGVYQVGFIAASGLAALIFAVLALMALHRLMVSRLPRLVDAVRQVRQQSDFNARITLGGTPELVALGSELNCLLATAQQEHERLQSVNLNLEKRVQERTAELEDARAQERVSAEQDRIYRTLFDFLPSGLMLESEDGVILDVNPALCTALGYERNELVGKPVSLLLPPAQRHQTGENLNRLRDGETLMHEVVNQRRDGSLCHLKLRERLVVLADGQRRVIVNAEDITGLQQAAQQAQLQSTALESSVNAIMIVDREGKITWVNRAFTALTGYTAEETVGQSPRLLKSGRHDLDFYRHLWATVTRGELWRGELVNRRKDGSLYLEEMTITPVLDTEGRVTHFIGIKQDITEQHSLQQQLFQAQKMESIGRLAGGIAHDFNNLLQAITGFCTLLLDQMNPDSPHRSDVQEIDKAAHRAAGLTRQLLAYSRRQVMEPKLVDPNHLVENLNKMLRRLLGEDIELILDLVPELDQIRVDQGQIEQVLLNLAVNARDAMPQGGRLTISTYSLVFLKEDTLLVPEARYGRFVCLAMSDTGVGMSEEVMAHIFEPFYSTKGIGKGTGLGLSVAYGIVRQHDGMLHVYSQLGQGSTFRIYLPVAETLAPQDGALMLPDQDLRPVIPGIRILLVEDEDGVRGFAARALRGQGYELRAVASVQEAVQVFHAENGNFDVLFTDVVLPDRNGLDLAEELLREKPGLRVLFTSGYMDDKSRWPAIREQGFTFLQKPYPVHDLLSALRTVLETNSAPPA